MDRRSQWQAAETARVQEKTPLTISLQVLELCEYFQLVDATLLKEKLVERNLELTFDLQITVLVRLRHTIPKGILLRDIEPRHHGNLGGIQAERGWLGVAGHKGSTVGIRKVEVWRG